MDQPDNAFARHVLSRGKAYLDITATHAFMEAVEALDDVARSVSATAVLFIGFAPGLTNLLARSCAQRLDRAERARIGVLLSLGDVHGKAAIRWMLGNVGGGALGRQQPEVMRFGRNGKASIAYPFPFADQHVVRKTLGLHQAETFLSFDNALLTRLVFRGDQFLKGHIDLQRVLSRLMARIRPGSDRAALAVEVSGQRNGQPVTSRAICEGRGEADITALVVERLLEWRGPGRRPSHR